MRILFAASEAYPLAKTGGLADVSAALPRALAELGVDASLVLPAYPQVLAAAVDKRVVVRVPETIGDVRLIRAQMPDSGFPLWLVDCPALYGRDGLLYTDHAGKDWPDNAQRFATFCRVAAKLALGELIEDWRADLVHANDWHTGLLPVFLAAADKDTRPPTVFTIHNLAYQGLFSSESIPSLGVTHDLFTPDGFEFYGNVSFLKAGIRFSDRVTTVSPSYAREIMTADYGCGLDGLLRHRMRHVSGILNGVDYGIWSPENDGNLPATFSAVDMSGKIACKASLQAELALHPDPTTPLLVLMSRITDQKMADVVTRTLHRIMDRDVQLAVLGDGDPALEEQFQDAAQHYPGRLSVRLGYQEPLAHRFLGGADVLLHPCRFEPCGLTPLYAMRYGVLPIVRHVGGLADTIVDASEWTIQSGSATGFCFKDETASSMLDCLDRTLAFYGQQELWDRMRCRAMSRRFGWDTTARRYLALYQKLVPAPPQTSTEEQPARASVPNVALRAEPSTPGGSIRALANSICSPFPKIALASGT